jgi:hypothetical protein
VVDCTGSLGAIRGLGDAGGRVRRHAGSRCVARQKALKRATAYRGGEAATAPDGTGGAAEIGAEAARPGLA